MSISWQSKFKTLRLKANITRFYSTSDGREKTISQQLKDMFKKYWYVLVPVHLVTSVLWCLGFYYIAASEIDIAEIMERLKFSEDWIRAFRRHKTAGNLALVFALYHLFAPLRYAVSLGGASLLKNYLKRRGIIKSQKKNRPN